MSHTTAIHLKKLKRPLRNGRVRQEWMLRWFDSNGHQRAEKIGNCGTMTKREAEAIRQQRQVDMDARRVPRDRAQKMTLQQFYEYHKLAIGQDRKASTRYEYQIAIKHACAALGKDKLISTITVNDVVRIKHAMKTSAATKGKIIGRLRAMFNRALDWELVRQNPFARQTMPRPKPKRMRIFQPKEIEAMINVSPSLWWKAFIQLAYTSGLRRQELLHLQWRDINFKQRTVTVIAKSAEKINGFDGISCRTLDWSPKTHQQRIIPIPDVTVTLFQDLKSQKDTSPYCFLPLERLELLERKREQGRLRERFEVVNNLLRSFKVIQSQAAQYLQRDDWEYGTIHDLRKSYGTRLADTVPMHVLQKWLGHSDVSVTAMYYLDVRDHHAELARSFLETSTMKMSH